MWALSEQRQLQMIRVPASIVLIGRVVLRCAAPVYAGMHDEISIRLECRFRYGTEDREADSQLEGCSKSEVLDDTIKMTKQP